MKSINKNRLEEEFQKALALEYIKKYCEEKKYSFDKLTHLQFKLLYDECAFIHYGNCESNGLINDMETLPQVVLLIKYENGNLTIEETPYTKNYLT